MKINAQYIGFNPKDELLEVVKKKIDKLDTFYSEILGCDLYMKLDTPHSRENKVVELKIKVPKNQFVVKKTDDSFEKAITFAADSMARILKKENQK